jgi:hypothetical protein
MYVISDQGSSASQEKHKEAKFTQYPLELPKIKGSSIPSKKSKLQKTSSAHDTPLHFYFMYDDTVCVFICCINR